MPCGKRLFASTAATAGVVAGSDGATNSTALFGGLVGPMYSKIEGS